MLKHIKRTAAVFSAAMLGTFAAAGYYSRTLPDSFYIQTGTQLEINSLLPVMAEMQQDDSLAVFGGGRQFSGSASLKLFGIVPIKTAEIQEIETPMLIPGGEPFGIHLKMDGVMVIRLGSVETENGCICPAEKADLRAGDIINSVGGMPVCSNSSLRDAVSASEGRAVQIEFTRSGEKYTCSLTPVYSASDGSYSAGMWVRDSLAGIGTITYYDTDSGTFGGLGHPVCDSETGVCIPISKGSACPVTVDSIVKGESGNPGMLEGQFTGGDDLGELICNNRCGVFGHMESPIPEKKALPMAFRQEVHTGSAEIICTTDGSSPVKCSAEIEETDLGGSDNTKNMVIHITDEALLDSTGGIVQGMSGSPVIQDGKLVGAVTHVFVDDPTRGYAVFCENMYKYGLNTAG